MKTLVSKKISLFLLVLSSHLLHAQPPGKKRKGKKISYDTCIINPILKYPRFDEPLPDAFRRLTIENLKANIEEIKNKIIPKFLSELVNMRDEEIPKHFEDLNEFLAHVNENMLRLQAEAWNISNQNMINDLFRIRRNYEDYLDEFHLRVYEILSAYEILNSNPTPLENPPLAIDDQDEMENLVDSTTASSKEEEKEEKKEEEDKGKEEELTSNHNISNASTSSTFTSEQPTFCEDFWAFWDTSNI